MVRYFQEGGFSMWLILIVGVASVAVAAVRRGEGRSRALWIGSYASLVMGVFGMAMGMHAVSQHIVRYADKGAAVAAGLGELSNNGTFSALLATALAVGALTLAPKRANTAVG